MENNVSDFTKLIAELQKQAKEEENVETKILTDEIRQEDYYELAKKVYEDFEVESKKRGTGYICPNFPFFNSKIEGLLPGLYFFAGRSNHGKTAFMLNLVWDYCQYEKNHLFGLYYTLDDTLYDVVPRLISMLEDIPVSVSSKPARYEEIVAKIDTLPDEKKKEAEDFGIALEKRRLGLNKLKKSNKHFFIIDSNTVTGLEQIIKHAKTVQQYVKEKDPKNNIIVCIDSFSDLQYNNRRFSNADEKYRQISLELKKFATELNIPIFGSAHLKKRNDTKRPILDDLKDTNRFIYDASAVFLLHNDVSENKQNASIFWGEPPNLLPIIEINWAKNKRSSYKGNSYCYFLPEYSKTVECSLEDMKRYDSLLYSN